MEKEFASFIQLENQIEKIVDLANKLKEENKQLREENEYLQIQNQSVTEKNSPGNGKGDQSKASDVHSSGLLKPQADIIRTRIKNALVQLDQLRQLVMDET